MPPPQLRPAGAPAPTPAPTLYAPWKRNDVAASLATTVYYSGPLRQQQQSTSTSSAPATSSNSGYNNTGGWFGSVWGGNFSSSWITWVSVVVLAGLLIGIATARFFYIRRYYPPTLRSYFLPAKGLHIKRLGIHLRAPPPRIPRDNPPNYLYATEYVYGARRRRRRGRQTVGDTVGEGGARMGERDEDDMFDVDLAEQGSMRGVAVRDELPRYYVDAGLPLYEVGDGTAAEEAERIRAEAAVSGAEADLEALPTAAEYEAASRAARSQAINGEVGGAANEGGGADDAGEGREEDGEADPPGGSHYPPRPPPIVRSTTGRSSLFATLYRSRTAGSNPPQRPPLRHVASDSARPRGSDDGIAASLASTSTVSTTIEGLPTVGRTLSYDSGATGSTSDVDPLGSKTRVKQLQPSSRPKLPEASSSMAKIDPEESAKEAEPMEERVEVVEEQDATFRIEDSDDDERSPADPAPPSSATDPQSRPT